MVSVRNLPVSSSLPYSTGARLVSVEGKPLILERASVTVEAKAGLARVVLKQRFRNPYDRPLEARYLLPLPAEGVVGGFSFRIGEARIIGVVQLRQEARESFEAALLEGHTAALLEEERSTVFEQRLANLPPGQSIEVELQIDQRLKWLSEGAWEWRFPTVVGPRYLSVEGRVEDPEALRVDVGTEPSPARLELQLRVEDLLAPGGQIESPSHPLRVEDGRVGFAAPAANLDRDVVVRWPVARPEVGLSLASGRAMIPGLADRAHGLLTVVPPSADAKLAPTPRDLVVLIDASGSMGGAPLAQVKRVVRALIEALEDQDQLELIAFSDSARRYAKAPLPATMAAKQGALKWLNALKAGGGTEMDQGIEAALAPRRHEAQRQVLLLTDGYIGFEAEIVRQVRRTGTGCRVHAVAVGAAPNRSLTQALARAGGGLESIVGLDEDVERILPRLLAQTSHPLVTQVRVSGSAVIGVAQQRLPDLYAGQPALISLELRPEGGEVVVEGLSAGGVLEFKTHAPALQPGEGATHVAALFAREAVEDLEVELYEERNAALVDRTIEGLGLQFGIATRCTSFVAVAENQVNRSEGTVTETVPQEWVHGLSAEGLGLRPSLRPRAQGRLVSGSALLGAAYSFPPGAGSMPPGMMIPGGSRPSLGVPAPQSSAVARVVLLLLLLSLAALLWWLWPSSGPEPSPSPSPSQSQPAKAPLKGSE